VPVPLRLVLLPLDEFEPLLVPDELLGAPIELELFVLVELELV
jgi:hypothetical protein